MKNIILIILFTAFVLLFSNCQQYKENFFIFKDNPGKCLTSNVESYNQYYDNNNDANFQSNVLNLNRFYTKNIQDEPLLLNNIDVLNIKNIRKPDLYYNQPETWRYKNEFVMNGGKLYNTVYGHDTLTDYNNPYSCYTRKDKSCSPPSRGATLNDDLRMGLGCINISRRSAT